MSRDPILRLEDILEAASAVDAYVEGFDYDTFVADRRTIDAVTPWIAIVRRMLSSTSCIFPLCLCWKTEAVLAEITVPCGKVIAAF